MLVLTTFSITARCEQTGMLGTAVCTAIPGVGALASFVEVGSGAVSTQSFVNPYLGIDSLQLMGEGKTAQEAMKTVLAADPGRETRQLAIVDTHGNAAGFTGSECTPWFGHLVGDGYVVAANMMVDEKTTAAMAESFESSGTESLPERLLRALEAGDATGGDFRGRQSASLLVYKTEEYPYLSLRVDENPQPVQELRRAFETCRRQLLPLMDAMPTRANPLGTMDPNDPNIALLIKHVSERTVG